MFTVTDTQAKADAAGRTPNSAGLEADYKASGDARLAAGEAYALLQKGRAAGEISETDPNYVAAGEAYRAAQEREAAALKAWLAAPLTDPAMIARQLNAMWAAYLPAQSVPKGTAVLHGWLVAKLANSAK